MSEPPHPSSGRSLHVTETPLDAAQRSLADALRTSFRILKFAMIVLVIAYFLSGVFTVEQSKQAMVLRLGRPVGEKRYPGMHWALPAPIDQIIEIPVRQSTTLTIDSHWLHLSDKYKNMSLDDVPVAQRGLHPVRDGALLAGDRGMVHIKWRVTYRIDDLENYVEFVADEDYTQVKDKSKAEAIITKLLERAAIDVVGGYTTEEATLKRLNELREQVKRRVNDDLGALATGIFVEKTEIPESTPPIQTRSAFRNVTRAENRKQTMIREAEQQKTNTLNEAAGAAHKELIDLLNDQKEAESRGDTAEVARLEAEISHKVEFDASGTAGRMIREAKGYYTSVVQQMRADAEQYDTLLDEWLQRRDLLVTRVWEEAKQNLMGTAGIRKMYRPLGAQFRIHVGLDPREREIEERMQYLRQEASDTHMHEKREPKYPGGEIR